MAKTPIEDFAKKQLAEAKKTAKMDTELAKYGKPTGGSSKGMVWTVGDMQRFFYDHKGRKHLQKPRR